MLIIGERINGLFKNVAQAIIDRDPKVIQELALHQLKCGANILDVNTGPAVDDQIPVIEWLVDCIQEVTDAMICLDSTNPAAIEAGLKRCKNKAMINSTTADQHKMDALLPLAAQYNAAIIGLAMNDKGVPKDANDRCALAMEIIANADAHGIPMTDLYLDPLVLPVNVGQEHIPECLEAIRQVKLMANPAPKTVVGLSNVSQGLSKEAQKLVSRGLINRTFLAMAMTAGLDAAIMDAEDEALVDTAATGEILLNQSIYCDSYLRVFRQK